jgi:ABC-type uncharacterized transport system substrate-binding protein
MLHLYSGRRQRTALRVAKGNLMRWSLQYVWNNLDACSNARNIPLRPRSSRPHSKRNSHWAACLLIGLCAALVGCIATPVVTSPAVAPAPAPGLIVLLSDSTPAFTGVQREIVKNYPQRVTTYIVGDESTDPALQKKIEFSREPVVVAVGLPAALLAQGLSGKKVIFCQVFNYEDAELVTPWMKGVAATAPVSEQFRIWKVLNPGLTKVGVITGSNLNGLMEQAKAAAREYKIRLEHIEVKSDKETLYAFKKLTPKIEGLWLVPDNRVLSNDVIRDIMAHSVKEGKQVAVFGYELLGLGGLISAETSYPDIAKQVLVRVRQAQEASGVPGAPVIPLTRSDIRINPVMAKRLNLKIPRTLQRVAYVP